MYAPITKGAPSVAGGTNSRRATNTHITPHPFSPQGITFSCLKPNLYLQVLTRMGRFRGPARQLAVPTSTFISRLRNRPILRALSPLTPSTNGTRLKHILLQQAWLPMPRHWRRPNQQHQTSNKRYQHLPRYLLRRHPPGPPKRNSFLKSCLHIFS